ncbi:MAG: hypothetical protein WBA74_04760 [Cyclobacteriaceae bacterium]
MNFKNQVFIGMVILLGIVAFSCDRLEEDLTRDQEANLAFSTDTVLFDTVLTSVGSITKRLRIFNPNDQAVELSRIGLGRGEDSPYSLIVNGEEGAHFENTVIFGGDSLLILVEVLIDPLNEATPFLVKDSVLVESNGNQSDIKLVAYGQDAIFIDGGVFNCDITLTAGRPYVIRDFALVDTLCTLTMEPGTRILMDNDALLAVRGTLKIAGDTANPVIIRNTRLDFKFSEVPGQWNGIFFLDGSKDNSIEHAEISNGQIGLSIGNPDNETIIDVKVSNTIIENMSFAGIFAVNAKITAVNNLINNCGTYMIANFGGGDYTYYHNTFTNIPNAFIREGQSVQFSDFLPISQTETINNSLKVEAINNIIWGGQDEELLVALQVGGEINIINNVIRSAGDWTDTGNFVSLQSNFPGFQNIGQRDFSIDSMGFSRDRGIPLGVLFDLLLIPRDDMPDIGALERIDSE